MKTELEVLFETILYYTNNPRGKSGGHCIYSGPCAVGRLLIDPEDLDIEHPNTSWGGICQIYNGRETLLLEAEYRGLSNQFLEDLQELHDNDCFWYASNGRNRLSEAGWSLAKRIYNDFCSVMETFYTFHQDVENSYTK